MKQLPNIEILLDYFTVEDDQLVRIKQVGASKVGPVLSKDTVSINRERFSIKRIKDTIVLHLDTEKLINSKNNALTKVLQEDTVAKLQEELAIAEADAYMYQKVFGVMRVAEDSSTAAQMLPVLFTNLKRGMPADVQKFVDDNS